MEAGTSARTQISAVIDNIERAIYGKRDVIKLCVAGFLARGHMLIEDVPGIGKTTLARALAKSIDCSFARIQFTSDLLPSDITGVSVLDAHSRDFEFRAGPIFSNVVLADEINRTTPKTQSALLEAMNERQVSIDNVTYPLPRPFVVLATQNPVEYEGTYPLPESQLDRFTLRLKIGYPAKPDEVRILHRKGCGDPVEEMQPVLSAEDVIALQDSVHDVAVDDSLVDYVMAVVRETRLHDDIELGVSPRGTMAFYQTAQAYALVDGRDYVMPDDIKGLAVAVLSHRIILKSRRKISGTATETAENVVREILDGLHVPL
jgi:MoxR-like ATPase